MTPAVLPGRPNGAAMIARGLARYDIPDDALEFHRFDTYLDA